MFTNKEISIIENLADRFSYINDLRSKDGISDTIVKTSASSDSDFSDLEEWIEDKFGSDKGGGIFADSFSTEEGGDFVYGNVEFTLPRNKWDKTLEIRISLWSGVEEIETRIYFIVKDFFNPDNKYPKLELNRSTFHIQDPTNSLSNWTDLKLNRDKEPIQLTITKRLKRLLNKIIDRAGRIYHSEEKILLIEDIDLDKVNYESLYNEFKDKLPVGWWSTESKRKDVQKMIYDLLFDRDKRGYQDIQEDVVAIYDRFESIYKPTSTSSELDIYKIEGNTELKMNKDTFMSYISDVKNLPSTIVFIYHTPIGKFIAVVRYLKGTKPSKQKTNREKDILRGVSQRYLDEATALQNVILVVNKSRKKVFTHYNRTIKALTDQFNIDELKTYASQLTKKLLDYSPEPWIYKK